MTKANLLLVILPSPIGTVFSSDESTAELKRLKLSFYYLQNKIMLFSSI